MPDRPGVVVDKFGTYYKYYIDLEGRFRWRTIDEFVRLELANHWPRFSELFIK